MTRRSLVASAIIVFFSIFAAAPTAVGGTIYTSLGPGFTFDSQISAGVGGPTSWVTGVRFEAANSGNLAQLFGAWKGTTENVYSVELRDDVNSMPGDLLESWNLSIASFDVVSLYTLTSVATPSLTSGDFYWVLLSSTGSGNAIHGWGVWTGSPSWEGIWSGYSSSSLPSHYYYYPGGVALLSADGPAAVPEPASLLLLGTGLIGVVRTARRRMRK